MVIKLDKTGTLENLENLLEIMESEQEIKSILIMACDKNNFNKTDIDPILLKLKKPVFGGIFPEIMFGTEKFEKGTIVAGLEQSADVFFIPELSNNDVDYEKYIEDNLNLDLKTKTMFVFVDGFAQRISSLIDSLFNMFGLGMNYIGGGAGSLSFEQKPVLFTNQGLMMDGAVLALTKIESGVGVNHGWTSISEPFEVTESEGNTIKSLNWEPAFQVYKKIVESHSGKKFKNDNFFDIAKGYPFGISKFEAERIVRDPIALGENNELICVGEVPQNSFVHILTGDTNSLINASAKALEIGKNNLGSSDNTVNFFIDCISRVLFLEDDFSKELAAVSEPGVPLLGALTLGEIANNGNNYLEFYNKTCVVGILSC